MAAIFKSAQKGGGSPTYKVLTSRLLISGGPLNKMIPLMEDPGGEGGGCTVTPLGPWTNMFVPMGCNVADFGRSVVLGHSGGCRCSGDHASLQARASVLAWVSGDTCWDRLFGSFNSEVLKKLRML